MVKISCILLILMFVQDLPLHQSVSVVFLGDSTCRFQALSFIKLHDCQIILNEDTDGKMPDIHY